MTFQQRNYEAGGTLHSREVWDSIALTYTVFDGAGTQVAQRPLTPAETTQIQAQALGATAEANRATLTTKGQQALATNGTYLGAAAIPAGAALTTTQLTTVVRALRAQTDALARQNNALIRLTLSRLDDISDT